MGLEDIIRNDILAIRTNTNDFGTAITFQAPTSPVTTATIVGKVNKHHLVFDAMGMVKANVLNGSVSVSMLSLTAASYPFRNSEGRVTFKGHMVTWTDVTGLPQTYVIEEWYPDEVTGLLTLILGEYGAN